uniref:AN1-type domain-containing protein n=2 Tax=Guillardia theta TaxID=55529 RepID=A0A7S4N7Q0_GUITH|mmetsp:Transcript_17873/g.58756  ORF Transcript_17873/g.58756 Transcript_17873/m.58756 type:complete len:100 (+) Transcript_17873:81-380(+)
MINLIGSNCRHCKLRFCVGHGMPELHGCGKAAKEEARASWMLEQAQAREETRLRQQGRPLETGWKQHKSAVLKNELQKKIAAKEEERARKKKDEDRKKK